MAEQEQKSAQESPQQQMEAVEAEIVESKFVKRWKTVHSFLLDEPHYISRFTSYVESDMGIKKNSALMAIEVIISLALIFSEDRHQQVISTCITVAYPMYNSFMLLVSQKNDESTKILLLYWIIYACFEPLEVYTSLLPLYWFGKTMFLLYVYLPPKNSLCEKWYMALMKLIKEDPDFLKKLGIGSTDEAPVQPPQQGQVLQEAPKQ